jgi:hypothetical protein
VWVDSSEVKRAASESHSLRVTGNELGCGVRVRRYHLEDVVLHALLSSGKDEAAADNLRCVGKSGELAGRRVRYIRLYDPESISNNGGNSVGYAELDTSADRKALKFQGHIEKDGTVYLADRRTVPVAQKVRPVSPRKR